MAKTRNLVDQALAWFDWTNQSSAPATPSVGPRLYGKGGLLWFKDTSGEVYLAGDIERIDAAMPGPLAVTTGTFRWGIPAAMRVESIQATLGTTGTTATTVDVSYSSTYTGAVTTLYTTQANRPSMASGVGGVIAALPDVRDLAAGGVLTVDIDAAGTGARDLLVSIRLRRTA